MTYALFVKITGTHEVSGIINYWRYEGMTDDEEIVNRFITNVKHDINITKNDEVSTVDYRVMQLQ